MPRTKTKTEETETKTPTSNTATSTKSAIPKRELTPPNPKNIKFKGKKETTTGKRFVGGYIFGMLDTLNSQAATRASRSRSKNVEFIMALHFYMQGYQAEVLRIYPQLRETPEFLDFQKRFGLK